MIPEQRAYIGLGSNLAGPVEQVRWAIERLERLPDTGGFRCSGLYRTPPWGRGGQPEFINAVAALETPMAPLELLRALQAIEREAGRVRDGERWGPRVLDLDLLLFGERVLSTPGLSLPHPRLHERAFVLVPLLELEPGIGIPGHGPAAGLMQGLDDAGIARLNGGRDR